MQAKNKTKDIKLQFKNAVELQQTCKIYLTTVQDDSWSFYFQKGCLIWATSSIHRFRRLYRLTTKFCPDLSDKNIKLREQEISELWEYLFVSILQQRQQITQIQAEIIIQEAIQEVLTDCLLAGDRIDKIKVIFETEANSMGAILRSPLFKKPIAKVDYKKSLRNLEFLVSDWNNLPMASFSPNYAPVVKDIKKLRKVVDSHSYKQLFYLINGTKTLRDLAILTKRDLLSLVRCLIPHLENKAIALQAVPDQQLEDLYFSFNQQAKSGKYNTSKRKYIKELELPLVVIVDDNPHTCQKITQVLNTAGYRVIALNDAAKTLIALLENQPNLIFLDAAMPAVNGYELCSQIKKMPLLKNIPIVILQNNKGIMDAVKAKMSGASELLEKPFRVKDALMLAQKYTQTITKQNDLAAS